MTRAPSSSATGTAPGTGLPPGAMLPPLRLQSASNPRYMLDTAAGRWLLLAFLPDAGAAEALRAALASRRTCLDETHAALFLITPRVEDLAEGRLRDERPGIRALASPAGEAFTACGFTPARGGLLLLDPTLRVWKAAPLDSAPALLARLAALPPPARYAGQEMPAPVLVLPRVLEPALCRRLIALYEAQGGSPSGFMREMNGRTVLVQDPSHKRRSDLTIEDPELRQILRQRLATAVAPALRWAFQFEATRVERYIVACYDAAEGGHFRAHRDNTTPATAHRRFAVTINLNAGDYEGGELSFPEFGPRRYRAPTGGAVAFSCSLLHAVDPVTRGRRYAFLPFLYDEAAARLRDRLRGAESRATFPQPGSGAIAMPHETAPPAAARA